MAEAFKVPAWETNNVFCHDDLVDKIFSKVPKVTNKRKKKQKKHEIKESNDKSYHGSDTDEVFDLSSDLGERLKSLLSKVDKESGETKADNNLKKKRRKHEEQNDQRINEIDIDKNGKEPTSKKKRPKKKKIRRKKEKHLTADPFEEVKECTARKDENAPVLNGAGESVELKGQIEEKKECAVAKSCPATNLFDDQIAQNIYRNDNALSEKDILVDAKSSKTHIKKDFKSKLQNKLSGAQFRWLNEQLYTRKSNDAFEMFIEDPVLFKVYHEGFKNQVKSWPQNPLNIMIDYLNGRGEELVVADMGCGEAKIAQNVNQKVYSFDFVATNKHIIACDMSKVPLGNEVIDIAIFCLSLMGKNIVDFLKEANRILKPRGILKIAEVVSRFTDAEKFIQDVCNLGFKFISKDTSNKMFLLMEFEKVKGLRSEQTADIDLKPCIYKRR